MKSRLFLALLCLFAMTLSVTALAQDPPSDDPLDEEGEVAETWDNYMVKAYSIQFFGGLFGGDRYLDLPVMGEQTEVLEGSQRLEPASVSKTKPAAARKKPAKKRTAAAKRK